MIPIRDTVRARRTPYLTYAIIAANVIVFVYMSSLEQSLSRWDFYDWIARWAVIPRQFVREPSAGEFVAIFTSMFLHAGALHILGNMWFLWIFGDNVEDCFGPAGFLALYFFSGVVAFGAQLLFDPTSPLPMLGASGAIAGILGAYLVLFPHARVLTLVPIFILIYFVELPAWAFLFIWLVFQNLAPATVARLPTESGGVAYWAHIGGFLAGAAVAWLLKEELRKKKGAARRGPPQILVDWEEWSRRQRARRWYRDWHGEQ
jgi:membrane associated rhomboid family serine protease